MFLQKAVALKPNEIDFANKLGIAFLQNNQTEEAEKIFESVLNKNKNHVSALTNLGFVKLRQGNVKEAEFFYFKALALDPDYDALLLNIAGLYAYKKDFKQFYVC